MSKNQKIEWITTGVFIVVFVSLMFAVIQNYDAWGNSPVSAAEVILMVAVIITAAVWLINYYIKTILALKRRTEPRRDTGISNAAQTWRTDKEKEYPIEL